MKPNLRHFLTLLLVCTLSGLLAGQSGEPSISVTPFSTGPKYVPGHWAALGLRIQNAGEEDADVTVSAFLGHAKTQFQRKVWCPARSVRIAWLPMQLPERKGPLVKSSAFSAQSVSYVVSVEQAGKTHRFVNKDSTLDNDQPIQISNLFLNTSVLFNQVDPHYLSGDNSAELSELIRASRRSVKEPEVVGILDDMDLSPYPYCYDGLDHFILCSDRLVDDSGALAAIRSWLADGGKMWVLLDQVQPETVRSLLGNSTCYEVFDHVELTEFQLETPQALEGIATAEAWKSEQPVTFFRVLLDNNAHVMSQIGQWPAIFSTQYGDGTVYFSAIGADGLLFQHRPHDAPDAQPPQQGATSALFNLTTAKLTPKPPPRVSEEMVKPLLEDDIGYSIAPRKTVSSILIGGLLIGIASAAVFYRFSRPEHLAWVIPVLCLATAGSLVAVARSYSTKVPSTAVRLTMVQVQPTTNSAQVRSFATLYSPDSSPLTIDAPEPGLATPGQATNKGKERRVDWSPSVYSNWNDSQLVSGSSENVSYRENLSLADPVRVEGEFTSEGFAAEVIGKSNIGEVDDAIIAYGYCPKSLVNIDDAGVLACSEDQTLPADQFITQGVVLTERQQRRQRIYRWLFDPDSTSNTDLTADYPTAPTLFMWSSDALLDWDLTPEGFQRRDSVLWAVPLTIRESKSGTSFKIPPTFLPMRSAGNSLPRSGYYGFRNGSWTTEVSRASKGMFRFVIPQQVQPCELTKATVSIRIQAPSRTVALLGYNASTGEIVTLDEQSNLNGVASYDITEADQLQLHDGSLIVGFDVSDASGQFVDESSDKKLTWTIDYFRVSVEGNTL